jgi:hypothetical protein
MHNNEKFRCSNLIQRLYVFSQYYTIQNQLLSTITRITTIVQMHLQSGTKEERISQKEEEGP